MPVMLREFKAVREIMDTVEVSSTLAQLLKRAWLALDNDAPAARREIHRALELLSIAPVQTEVQPVHYRRQHHGLAPWQVCRVIHYIQENIEISIQVEDMAGLTRLSTSHFFRAFKRSFGMAPHAYVIACRIVRARELLVRGNDQMAQIALACGFADQAHFSRVFRREVGCAPSVWRREQRGLRTPDPAAIADNGAGHGF